jgi:putative copper resistance protein D
MEVIVAVRSIHIGAAVLVAGAGAFEFLVWPRNGQADAVRPAVSRWLRVSTAWALAVALLTWAVWLVLIAASMSAASPSLEVLEKVLAQTNFGHVWILRFSLGLLVAIELGLRGQRKLPLRLLGAAAAALFLVSLAWAGHAVAAQPPSRALHLGADACHLLGAGLWLGALLPLCFVLGRARGATGQAWLAPAAAAARNFSTVGVVAVLTLLISGVANTVFQVGSFSALLDTAYGQRVSAKIVLFLAIILIAIYNRVRLVPRIEATGPAVLYRNAIVEVALGGAIIVLVGMLGNMAPSSHRHEPGMQHTLSPWAPGPNAASARMHSPMA